MASNNQNMPPSGSPARSGAQRHMPKFGGPYSSLSASSQRMQQYLSLVFSSDSKKQGGRVNPSMEVEASPGNSPAVGESAAIAIPMDLEVESVEMTPMPDLVTSCVLSVEEQRKRYSRLMKSNKRMKMD